MKTVYANLSEIDGLQTKIMQHISVWVHKEREPIPLKTIITEMENQGIKQQTTIKAINILIKKHYIRRAITISNKTSFVQLRTI